MADELSVILDHRSWAGSTGSALLAKCNRCDRHDNGGKQDGRDSPI